MRIRMRALLAAALLTGPLVFGFVAYGLSEDGESCPEEADLPKRTLPQRLRLNPVEETRIVFGASRGAKSEEMLLALQDSAELPEEFAPEVQVGTPRLKHAGNNANFKSTLVAYATYSEADDGVELTVCADLATGTHHPGVYEGSVRITDDRFHASAIPLRIEIRDRDWYFVLAAALLGGIAGALYGSASSLVATWDSEAKGPTERKKRRRMVRRLATLSLIAGLVSGVGFFLFEYLDANAFEARWGARRDVMLVAFAFGLTLSPVIVLVERVLRYQSSDGEDPVGNRVEEANA